MGFVLRACLAVIEKKMGIWVEVEVNGGAAGAVGWGWGGGVSDGGGVGRGLFFLIIKNIFKFKKL